MSGQQELYVMVDYRDPQGHDHARGETVMVEDTDEVAKELLFRGVLSTVAPRRQSGENSARISGEGDSA